MKKFYSKLAISVAVGAGLAFGVVAGTAQAETPKRGGILKYVVGSKIPSFDLHRETTFGVVQPIKPFYSGLIRVNPSNPADPTDFVCDICVGSVPKGEKGGTSFTFKIRKDVKFHDGTPLTAHDVVATWNKIIFPPKGIPSARKAFFRMVESVTVKDDYTVHYQLKFPSGAFIPALATPHHGIYSKKDLDTHGYNWHTKNINGTGAYKFVQYQPGALVEGARYDGYHHKGVDGKPKPYLDGFHSISAPKMSVRIQAVRSGRADIEFRGFPPKVRDDLVKALGDRITVSEIDWNCNLMFQPNHKMKPFDDARVRRALTLAVDRWSGAKHLAQIAIVKTVGGVVYPLHPLARNKAELQTMAGYGADLAASRAKAKKLLKEAGQSGLKFTLHNRAVDQPYKVVGTWLIGQWKEIGLNVKQLTQPTGPFFASLRKKKDFQVSIDFNCQAVINPIADVSKHLGSAGNNYGNYEDQALEDIYDKLLRAPDPASQRKIMHQYEKRVLDDEAHQALTLWWYKINPYRSYVKGWKSGPSHYLNMHLDNIWLDK
tara:strand:+ start:552 stop:2183 length:1632 start_codon:yes stop_codon:yes gene_type:complete